jgi:hypothetical protein
VTQVVQPHPGAAVDCGHGFAERVAGLTERQITAAACRREHQRTVVAAADLLTLMLSAWADDETGPTLRAVLQTAAHEESTREKLRKIVESSLMGVSHLGVDEHDRKVRSGLIASQLMGLAMMRYVWHIQPVASMSDEELIAAVTPNLQHYINGDLSAQPAAEST